MVNYAVTVNNLTKKFGNFTAVDNVSFNVKKSSIFGFLGANGAGKSTTIRMLCGLLTSTSGSAKVAGFDINKESEEIKKNIGYMSQKFSLYDDLSVDENINFFGGVYGLSDKKINERKKWLFEMADLKGKEKRTTKDLPSGWKQRLALGCAMLHDPEVIFLDEPTGGVDPVSRRNFWELINQLSEKGVTIFVTTHYLDEAEFCNNILLIQGGKIIAGGTPLELKINYLTSPILEIECSDPFKATELLIKNDLIKDFTLFGLKLHITVSDEKEGKKAVKKLFNDNGIKINYTAKILPSLEDVFIHLVEKY